MARSIIWTEGAQKERLEILQYWMDRNQSNSFSKYLNQLFVDTVEIFAMFPQAGRSTDKEHVKVATLKDYSLFYSFDDKSIVILAVWDNRQNPADRPF